MLVYVVQLHLADDIILRRWSKMSLHPLETRRRYDPFKGSDPTPSSLMRRATGLCAEKGEEDVLSVAHVPWGRLMLRIPTISFRERRGRWNEMEQSRWDGDGTRRVGSNKRQIYSTMGLAGDEGGKQASTGKEARQACETLPIAVGRGCIDQDEAGRRSLPTPLFPLLALFLPLLAPTRRRVLFLRSLVPCYPSFLWYWPQPPRFHCWGRNAAITDTNSRQSLTINISDRWSSKIYSFTDPQAAGKRVRRLALCFSRLIDFSRSRVFMPWIIYADNFVPISLPPPSSRTFRLIA